MMMETSAAVLVLLLTAAGRIEPAPEPAGEVKQCPPWTEGSLQEDVERDCVCGASIEGVIQCDNSTKQTVVLIGWCVTQYSTGLGDNTRDKDRQRRNYTSLVAGLCPYLPSFNTTNRASFELPRDPAELDQTLCSHYHRTGLLCGECISGYGPSVYSFDLHCSNCFEMSTLAAAALYLVLETVPITSLFLVLMVLQVNIMSGPMLGYVVFCQYYIVVLGNAREVFGSITSLSSCLDSLTHFSLTLSAVWSLQFFRFIVPPFCFNAKVRALHVIMLRLSTALFPLCLVGAVYALLEANLQDSRLCLVRHVYKRLHKLFSLIKRQVSSSSHKSVIRVFATFILLSISTLTFVTGSLTAFSSLYTSNGEVIRRILFIDPTVERFTSAHIPYLIVGLVLMFVLIFCPALILIVYPTSLYHSLSHQLSHRKQIFVKIFVETFQESFKDGLNGTRDFRMIPGVAIMSAVFYILSGLFNIHDGSIGKYYVIDGFVDIVLSLAISCAQPCKTWATNASLSFHFTLLGVWSILFGLWVQDFLLNTELLALALVLLPLLPHLLMAGWLVWRVTAHLLLRYRGTGTKSMGEMLRMVCGCLRRGVQGWKVRLQGSSVRLRGTAAGYGALRNSRPSL